ncbi:MAG: hypothetical protein Q9217_001120 [Psora testacea]
MSITTIEPLIQEKIDKLCLALSRYAETQEPIELGLAYMALTLDIISHYAFGASYGLVDQPGFSPLWKDVISMTMESFALVRNLPWLPQLLKRLPHPVTEVVDKGLAFYLKMEREMRVEVAKMVGNRSKGASENSASLKDRRKNIFEELIDSNLPPAEKTVDRLNEEGFALILAGGDTSSQTLSQISYHLLANPDILRRLKAELYQAMPDATMPARWAELEKLPFLRACITEGLRVNAIATSRSVRVARKETLHYKDWVIEPGVRRSFLSPYQLARLVALDTPVGMNTHFMHLNPELFPNPNKFDPERWLRAEAAGETKKLEKYFNPFGKGSRNCIGLKRLELELFETTRDDVTIVCDAFIGHPKRESKGVRVRVLSRLQK